MGTIVGIYLLISLTIDGLIWYFQPESKGTSILRTLDEFGDRYGT